jgi:hypothetical protein
LNFFPLPQGHGTLRPTLTVRATSPGAGVGLAAGWTGPCRSRLACSPNCLGRIKCYTGGALENLITAGAVPPVDIHPVELRLLSALVQLCHCDSASLLQRAA